MKKNNFEIVNTSINDWVEIIELLRKAMELQGRNGYRVWSEIDEVGLKKDIKNRLQYKIVQDGCILCIFSVQLNDPFIWQKRDNDDAIYLHRIVVNPIFKGMKQFEKILNWSKQFAHENNLKFVRMDTWADNIKIIDYYKSFGFRFLGNCTTGDVPELPIQNRRLEVALLEISLEENIKS